MSFSAKEDLYNYNTTWHVLAQAEKVDASSMQGRVSSLERVP